MFFKTLKQTITDLSKKVADQDIQISKLETKIYIKDKEIEELRALTGMFNYSSKDLKCGLTVHRFENVAERTLVKKDGRWTFVYEHKNEDFKVCKMGWVDTLSEVVEYMKENNYVIPK